MLSALIHQLFMNWMKKGFPVKTNTTEPLILSLTVLIVSYAIFRFPNVFSPLIVPLLESKSRSVVSDSLRPH